MLLSSLFLALPLVAAAPVATSSAAAAATSVPHNVQLEPYEVYSYALSRMEPLLATSYNDSLKLAQNSITFPSNTTYWVETYVNWFELKDTLSTDQQGQMFLAMSGFQDGKYQMLNASGGIIPVATKASRKFSYGSNVLNNSGPGFQLWLSNATCVINTTLAIDKCLYAVSEQFEYKPMNSSPLKQDSGAVTTAQASAAAGVVLAMGLALGMVM